MSLIQNRNFNPLAGLHEPTLQDEWEMEAKCSNNFDWFTAANLGNLTVLKKCFKK